MFRNRLSNGSRFEFRDYILDSREQTEEMSSLRTILVYFRAERLNTCKPILHINGFSVAKVDREGKWLAFGTASEALEQTFQVPLTKKLLRVDSPSFSSLSLESRTEIEANAWSLESVYQSPRNLGNVGPWDYAWVVIIHGHHWVRNPTMLYRLSRKTVETSSESQGVLCVSAWVVCDRSGARGVRRRWIENRGDEKEEERGDAVVGRLTRGGKIGHETDEDGG